MQRINKEVAHLSAGMFHMHSYKQKYSIFFLAKLDPAVSIGLYSM